MKTAAMVMACVLVGCGSGASSDEPALRSATIQDAQVEQPETGDLAHPTPTEDAGQDASAPEGGRDVAVSPGVDAAKHDAPADTTTNPPPHDAAPEASNPDATTQPEAAVDNSGCPTVGASPYDSLPLMRRTSKGYCIDVNQVTRDAYHRFITSADTVGRASAALAASEQCKAWRVGDSYGAINPGDYEDLLPKSGLVWCDAFAFCAAFGKRLCGRIGGGDLTIADWGGNTMDPLTSEWRGACDDFPVDGGLPVPLYWVGKEWFGTDPCMVSVPTDPNPELNECWLGIPSTCFVKFERPSYGATDVGFRCCAD